MGRLQVVNNNMYRKISTGGDFNRYLGVLKDSIVEVSSSQAISRIIPTGFKYLMGTYELEVYVNGIYKRPNQMVGSENIGDYVEFSNFSVLFNSGIISEGDIIRFRVTSANYKITNYSGAGSGGINPTDFNNLKNDVFTLKNQISMFNNNLLQVSKDVFGDLYSLKGTSVRSSRIISTISDGDTTPSLKNYRTFMTSNTSSTEITNFDDGLPDDIRYIIFGDDNTIIKNNSSIVISKDSDIIGRSGNMVGFLYDGSIWRQIYGDNIITKIVLTISSWIISDGNYYCDINIENLKTENIIVMCYNSLNKMIEPLEIEITSSTNVRIWMSTNTETLKVVIIG